MSSLPQRKKSAGEIAELREQLGVTDQLVAPAAQANSSPAAAVVTSSATADSPGPASEPALEGAHAGARAPGPAAPTTRAPKACRSLRKSEQQPIEARPLTLRADSPLPIHRHSAEEIEEIRRREMLAQMAAVRPNPKFRAAHPALVTIGYLLAATGSTIFWRKDFPWAATIAFCATALLLAIYLFLRTPVSRHHAGFISLIATLVAVFASLQQFPPLQHAT